MQEIDDLEFTYSATNVVNNIVNPNTSDIAFPLISSQRAWQYGIGGVNDISTTGGSLKYNEIFPALRVKRIFQAIEERYNISFLGDFLNDKRFTELFLLCKNSEKFQLFASSNFLNFVTYVETGTNPYIIVDIYRDEVIMPNLENIVFMQLKIDVVSSGNWVIEVYKNNELFRTFSGSGNFSNVVFSDTDSSNNGAYKFKFTTSDYATTSVGIRGVVVLDDSIKSTVTITTNIVTSSILDIKRYFPDMKVSDFFSGILKMFNLTAYSENENVYNIEPLEDWYNAGVIRDITKYVNLDGEITRAPFYKVMNFQYEKSESLINRAFADNFQREFGDLKYTFDVESDGDEYTIKLPFENLMHQKFSGTKLHVGYCLKSDLKPYVPKPILLYKYGNINTGVNFYLEGSARTSYNAFGQDIEKVTDEFHTLNWGLENSTLLNGVVENTLFSDYYLSYLSNIYNRKSRIIKIEGVADTYLMSVLKLNDRVVIRDKRYVINNIQTELNTGKINLELLTDFRAI